MLLTLMSIPMNRKIGLYYQLHSQEAHSICINTNKMQWHIFVPTAIQTYAIHSHALLREMTFRKIYGQDNRLQIVLTSSHICLKKNWTQRWISVTNIMFLGRHTDGCIPLNEKKLPHTYISIWPIEKITSNNINKFIWAVLPDVNIDPRLFEVVTKKMIYSPCGAINKNSPYMKDGKCWKCCLRDLHTETITYYDVNPYYHWRSTEDGGHFIALKRCNNDSKNHNRWVVLALLSKTFNAYIRFEYHDLVQLIKYICTNVNKESDMLGFGVGTVSALTDEIELY